MGGGSKETLTRLNQTLWGFK